MQIEVLCCHCAKAEHFRPIHESGADRFSSSVGSCGRELPLAAAARASESTLEVR